MVGMAQTLYFHPLHLLEVVVAVVQEITAVVKMAAPAVAQPLLVEVVIIPAAQAIHRQHLHLKETMEGLPLLYQE
jgi:hypothetical protein